MAQREQLPRDDQTIAAVIAGPAGAEHATAALTHPLVDDLRRAAARVLHEQQARDGAAFSQKAVERTRLCRAEDRDQSSSNSQSAPKLSRFGVVSASPFGPSRRTTSVWAVAVSSFSRVTTVITFTPGD